MAALWLILGALLVVVLSVFYAQNPNDVPVVLFGPSYRIALWLLIAIPALLGLVLGYLFALPARVRGAFSARRLNNTLREQDKTIAAQQQRIAELERDLTLAQAALQAPAEVTQVAPGGSLVPVAVPTEAMTTPANGATASGAQDGTIAVVNTNTATGAPPERAA